MKNDLWKSLSTKVLSSILVDNGAVLPVMDVIGKKSDWFPIPDDNVYGAILECVNQGIAPTVEAVSERTSAVNMQYVAQLAAAWTDDDNRNLMQNAERLKQYGMLSDVVSIGRRLSNLDDPDLITKSISEATVALSGMDTVQSNRQPDAASVNADAWTAIASFDPDTIIPTGMDWFDKKASGLWEGMMYWIVGAYKTGKSTVMRNIALNALEHGAPIDVFAAEGSREMFALSIQSMVATRWLLENQYTKRLILSPLFIMRAWRQKQAVFSKEEIKAIDVARNLWDTYPIRVWDTSDGIRDVKTLAWRIRQSKLRYGTRVVFVDYLQLLGDGDTEYQRVSNTSRMLQEIAQSEKVAIVVLAQRNESAINSSTAGHSPGVKGGGDAAATADFLFLPSFDQTVPNVMDIKLHLSRWTAKGAGTHMVNQQSGLFIDRFNSKTY